MELTNYSSIPVLCNYIKSNEYFSIPLFDISDNDKINYMYICEFISNEDFVRRKFDNIDSFFDDIDLDDVFNNILPFETLSVCNKMYIINQIFQVPEYRSKYLYILIEKYPNLVVYQYFSGER